MTNEELYSNSMVRSMQKALVGDETVSGLVEFFKLFSDSTRLKILYALSMSEICVNDLSELLNINQSAVSHQLKTLRNADLVKYRRQGKQILYSLDNDHIGQVLLQGLLYLSEE